MRVFTIFLMNLIVLTTIVVVPVEAAKNPNRVTTWNKMTDWFATAGKKDVEKRRILLDRRKRRQEARVFKAHQKKKKQIQNQMREQQRKIMKTVDKKRVPHGRGGIDERE